MSWARRREGQPAVVRAEAAGRRLQRGWAALDARGKRSPVAAVAVARELAGWVPEPGDDGRLQAPTSRDATAIQPKSPSPCGPSRAGPHNVVFDTGRLIPGWGERCRLPQPACSCDS